MIQYLPYLVAALMIVGFAALVTKLMLGGDFDRNLAHDESPDWALDDLQSTEKKSIAPLQPDETEARQAGIIPVWDGR